MLQPVKEIYFSEPSEMATHKAGNKKMVWIFITIALLTLFMSLFNYINYTISKQLQTLKQMGIRMATEQERVRYSYRWKGSIDIYLLNTRHSYNFSATLGRKAVSG